MPATRSADTRLPAAVGALIVPEAVTSSSQEEGVAMTSTVHDLQPGPNGQHVELAIGGMTCASCAARVERKLNRLDGVTATVNFATEKASVRFTDGLSITDLVKVVEDTGYTATLPQTAAAAEGEGSAGEEGYDEHARSLRQRMRVSVALAVPVIVMAMVPPAQFTYWQWLSLALAAPVVVWGAWPFHRAAATNLKHGAFTMDTLISLGVAAAFLWSLYALFFGGAGAPGLRHGFR